jgi:aspartyl-tRNA(Asn)/glutamyl-tRNA(Gln) amidotransferase subunit B
MEYEVDRQTRLLEAGERVASETRGWRDETNETASQRSKEQAHDYRYFPEPDLPPLAVPRELVESLQARLPELPDARYERFTRRYGLTDYEAALLTETRPKADFFETALLTEAPAGEDALRARAKSTSNWLLGDLSKLLNNAGIEVDEAKVEPAQLASLITLVESGKLSGTAGKQVLEAMFESGRDPAAIVAERGLGLIEDKGVVAQAVSSVLAANAKAVADYRAGKTEALKFIVGQVMKETRGRANAAEVQALVRSELEHPGG